jgi:transcriptional regulator with XRE-family HTH domain
VRANVRLVSRGPATPERPLPRVRPATIRPKSRTWGGRLRNLRETVGLNQDQLAAGAGLRQMTLSNLERDQSAATETTVVALAGALGVTPQELSAYCERGVAITPLASGTRAAKRRQRMEFRAVDDSFSPWIRRGDRVTVDPNASAGPDPTPAVVLSADDQGDLVPVLALVMSTVSGVLAQLAIGAGSRVIDAREVFPVVRIDREATQ